MNANTIINMVMRIIMRKVIGAGISKGMGAVGKGVNKARRPRDQDQK